MRRGHPGAGGWRGENPRHFRPRGGGTPNFRPSRPFGSLDIPRYQPPGPRPFRGSRPYASHLGRQDNVPQSEHHDRNKFRVNNTTRNQDRGYQNRDRQMPPYKYQLRQKDNDHGDPYTDSNFYKNPNQCHINKMGDIDHRRQHQISPWTNAPSFDNNRQYYDDHRSPHKTPRHFNLGDDLPDYSGHRPPASDHYTTTTTSNNNNSQYTHSVDDTVDIIRKRLQNRDKQQSSDSSMDHQNNMDEDLRINTKQTYQNVPQEQPVKKKVQRQKQNVKSNCDKMKDKIVHQLFKMDKVKIHKLLDNPCSSNKFEYAISSLITEGQNSLNRHLRSVAEKSLCSSSADFIQDDTNTIYEDTFMKQMQSVLDPQDTVLLEDIKPLVMAELSRVLQLDEYQFERMQDGAQNHEMQDHEFQNHGMLDYEMYNQHIQDQTMHGQEFETQNTEMKEEPSSYPYDDEHNMESYSQDNFFDENQPSASSYNNIEIKTSNLDDRLYEYDQQQRFESKPLFERRSAKKIGGNEERHSEYRKSRNSIDKAFGYQQEYQSPTPNQQITDNSKDCAQAIPLFDPNADQLSEDDDPFAEFDKQYHVAVDHNFIENENASRPPSPIQSIASNSNKSPCFAKPTKTIDIPSSSATSNEIKKQIDAQLQNIAQSPVKLFTFESSNSSETATKFKPDMEVKKETEKCIEKEPGKPDMEVKKETEKCLEKENTSAPSIESHVSEHVTHDGSSNKKESKKEIEKQETSAHTKSVLPSNSRKRSTDQKPSHRKEKRKRSSHSESQEAAKSILNMFYTNDESKKETLKEVKKSDSIDKTYSDKYVKRKEPQKKAKERDSDALKSDEAKKLSNNSSSHSNLSPKETHTSETPPKSDSKIKLKPIDIFGVQHQKKASTHQAHRNTAVTPQAAKSPDDKPKPIIPTMTSFARKLSKRHVGTQVVLKLRTKECQTHKVKFIAKETQTDPVSMDISKDVATNPLERMKEIDMEIQLLLQEKFKLYNSLETKSTTVPIDTIPSLSMRVFNVNTEEKDNDEKTADSEDTIVDNFTSIPTEELEQIALETIADEKCPLKAAGKRQRRQRAAEIARKNSASPNAKRCNKKAKSPNISLIEQIITDDRPIEDIISLDDLETTPARTKKRRKTVPKKKISKKPKSAKYVSDALCHDIRECSVVLERIDISYYLRPKPEEPPHEIAPSLTFEVPVVKAQTVDHNLRLKSEEFSYSAKPEITHEHEEIRNQTPMSLVQVVDDVVNDLQFDMLDVSEDIIIGDNCEVKGDDKAKEAITEEIILDNSQSSLEDAPETNVSDTECKMYDYSTNENLRRDAITVTGNADAVLAIECIDNDFIAACLDGNVYHFNGDGQLLNTLRGTNQAVTCLTIVQEKYGTTVYTGSLDSRIRYYDLETGLEKGPECNVLSPIQTMDRAWDTVFVGTRTGFVLQFECKNNMLIPVSTVKFSEQSILALRAMKEGPRKVLLVAARSENVVTIKDAQTGLLLRTLQGPKMSVYTLLFEDGKVYCGTSSHNIHVFDYTTGNHVGSHEGGKGAVCLRASGGLLFAGCYDGCVYVYREGESRPLAQLRGPSLMLLSLAIHGTKIIAGYKDRGLYIWKMPLAIVQEMIL